MCLFLSRHKLPGWSQNVTASRRSWSSPDLPLPARLTTPPVEPMPLIEEDDSSESRAERGGEEGEGEVEGNGGEKRGEEGKRRKREEGERKKEQQTKTREREKWEERQRKTRVMLWKEKKRERQISR